MFTLKSLPIRIDPLFWILAFGLGFYYSGSFAGILIWGFVILASVLIHELGHALTAQVFGQEASITLTFFGGVTKRSGPSIAKWKEFLIVLNGPLAGFSLALVALWLTSFQLFKSQPLILAALTIAYYVNYFWTFLNLFPIQPLDGGHLTMILLQGLFGYRGIKMAYFLSGIVAALFGLLFFFMQQVFLGAVFFIFAFDSFKNWKSSLHMSKMDQSETLQEEVSNAEKLLQMGYREEAKEKLTAILAQAQTHRGILSCKTSELLALIYLEEGDFAKAYTLLEPYRKNLDTEGLSLLQKIAFENRLFKESAEIGTEVHQEFISSKTALINALSHAELRNADATIGWLKTAIDEGILDPQQVLLDSRFDFVRNSSSFQNLLK
ncbi:Uncharacterized protein PHSC3_001991 [Chlamydiales bacterium STE3]|nr:Uncharacterized protein PHSC3_001991 [Chlamydiales bacterium STE3]